MGISCLLQIKGRLSQAVTKPHVVARFPLWTPAVPARRAPSSLGSGCSVTPPAWGPLSASGTTLRTHVFLSSLGVRVSDFTGPMGKTQTDWAGTPWAHARRGHSLCPSFAGVCRPQVSRLREPLPLPGGGSRRDHRSWAPRQPSRSRAWRCPSRPVWRTPAFPGARWSPRQGGWAGPWWLSVVAGPGHGG